MDFFEHDEIIKSTTIPFECTMEQFIEFINTHDDIREKYSTKYSIAGSSSRGLGEEACLQCIKGAEKKSNNADGDIGVNGKDYQVKEVTSGVFMAGTKLQPMIHRIVHFINNIDLLFDDSVDREKINKLLPGINMFLDIKISDEWWSAASKYKKNNGGNKPVIDFTDISVEILKKIFIFNKYFIKSIDALQIKTDDFIKDPIYCGLLSHRYLYSKILKICGIDTNDDMVYKKIEEKIKEEFFKNIDGLLTVDSKDGKYSLFSRESFYKNFRLESLSQTVRAKFKYCGKTL